MISLYPLPHKDFVRLMISNGREYSICLICYAIMDFAPNERQLRLLNTLTIAGRGRKPFSIESHRERSKPDDYAPVGQNYFTTK